MIFEKKRLTAEDAWIQFLVVVLVKLYQIGLFLKLIKSILGGNPRDVGWNLGRLDVWVGR